MPTMNCERTELLLSDHADGALDDATRIAVEAHLATCASCRAAADDIAAIVAGARALPMLTPGRDLWQGIAARIEAPVLDMTAARDDRAGRRRFVAMPPWWRTAAAAAVLVAATAAITNRATIYATRDSATAAPSSGTPTMVAARRDSGMTANGSAGGTSGAVAVASSVDSGAVRDTGAAIVAPSSPRSSATLASRPATRRLNAGAAAPAAPLPAGAAVYDQEITAMRAVLRERRGQLDTATVRVLERNLKLIDQAITESRAALARDPESGLLSEQLTRAMRRKLELLRTAAALPARAT